MQAFDQSLQALLKKEIPAHELTVIKRILMKDALVGLASNMGLARQLAELEQQFGSWEVMFDWYDQMFAVTPEEVRQVAKELLVPRGRTVGFLERKGGQL
jgi:predicted Zn-dependent peptidase